MEGLPLKDADTIAVLLAAAEIDPNVTSRPPTRNREMYKFAWAVMQRMPREICSEICTECATMNIDPPMCERVNGTINSDE